MVFKSHHQTITLLLILTVSAYLRFTNLMWGAPYFFDPDERNTANAVTQLRLPENLANLPDCLQSGSQQPTAKSPARHARPLAGLAGGQQPACNLNPHFFAYGHFPIYLAFLSTILTRDLLAWKGDPLLSVSFPDAIFWLRFWSATASTLTVLAVYALVKQILGESQNFHRIGEWFFSEPSTSRDAEEYMGKKELIAAELEDTKKKSTSRFQNLAILAALFTAFTPGLIQSAHIGTTESILTFFFMNIIYLSLRLTHIHLPTQKTAISYLLLAICLGLALGTKLSAGVFFVPVGLAFFFRWFKQTTTVIQKKVATPRKIASIAGIISSSLGLAVATVCLSLLVALLTSPYNVLDLGNFVSTSRYEIDVARGTTQVFYTRQFIDTVPVFFQLKKIFPFALGQPLFLLGLVGILISIVKIGYDSIQITLYKHSSPLLPPPATQDRPTCQSLALAGRLRALRAGTTYYLLPLISFFSYFLPNAWLFAKWTRFMTPIFPLFSVFATLFLYQAFSVLQSIPQNFQNRNPKSETNSNDTKLKAFRSFGQFNFDIVSNFVLRISSLFMILLIILPGLAFFTIYTREDVRLTASRWIYEHIPTGSHVLSETANVIDIPVILSNSPARHARPLEGVAGGQPPTVNVQVVSFDFYHLDENRELVNDLVIQLDQADYIFIPSRRLFANSMRLPSRFPVLTRYYEALFSGALGFEEVAKFTSYPKLAIACPPVPGCGRRGNWQLETSDEEAEETWTVFDHPVVRIYKKARFMTKKDYEQILDIKTM